MKRVNLNNNERIPTSYLCGGLINNQL